MPDRRRVLAWAGAAACAAAVPSLAYPACAVPPGEALPADVSIPLPPFVAGPPGEDAPAGWRHHRLPRVEQANRFAVVDDDGASVLRVDSHASASVLSARLRVEAAHSTWLSWRWKVSRALHGSDLQRKSGDDFAARLYVLFDLPPERLLLTERVQLHAASLLAEAELPAAVLCYVWGSDAQTPGSSAWSPYTGRQRTIVVDAGSTHAGGWREVRRDLSRDFREAFADAAPAIVGVSLGADTDNTGEQVEARFADLRFEVSAC